MSLILFYYLTSTQKYLWEAICKNVISSKYIQIDAVIVT